jgi:hypothetical protein
VKQKMPDMQSFSELSKFFPLTQGKDDSGRLFEGSTTSQNDSSKPSI